MTNFSIQPGQYIKPSQIWGLGSLIGERQTTIVTDSDYNDLEAVQDTVMASFVVEPSEGTGSAEK